MQVKFCDVHRSPANIIRGIFFCGFEKGEKIVRRTNLTLVNPITCSNQLVEISFRYFSLVYKKDICVEGLENRKLQIQNTCVFCSQIATT